MADVPKFDPTVSRLYHGAQLETVHIPPNGGGSPRGQYGGRLRIKRFVLQVFPAIWSPYSPVALLAAHYRSGESEPSSSWAPLYRWETVAPNLGTFFMASYGFGYNLHFQAIFCPGS